MDQAFVAYEFKKDGSREEIARHFQKEKAIEACKSYIKTNKKAKCIIVNKIVGRVAWVSGLAR